jgi:choline dehydrogenase
MNYLSTERDQEVAIESIELTREIVSCMEAKYQPREVKPGLEFRTKEELLKAAGGLLRLLPHPFPLS